MHWIVVMFLVGVVVTLIGSVITHKEETKPGSLGKGVPVLTVGFIALIMAGLGTLDGYFNELPSGGVHQVTSVELPEFAGQKTVVLWLRSAHDFDIDKHNVNVGGIPGFDHCCTQKERPCGCIEVTRHFWTLTATAKAVPCPDGTFTKFSDCGVQPAVEKGE
jgi:hypothetical protein